MPPNKKTDDPSLIPVSVCTDDYEEMQETPKADQARLVKQLIDSATVPGNKRLDIHKAIASGGVAAIWFTSDQSLGRHVALKLMHEKAANQPILLHGFVREAQVTAQLSHPGVVPVHEMGTISQRPYFAMALAKGVSLARWLQDIPPGDYQHLTEFLEIVIKVCDTLEYAHSRSVVHCDLKPANIMVGSYGEVYLMDWGGAQILHDGDNADSVTDRLPPLPSEETDGKVFGTPVYMTPEQANGETPDKRWDVFAIGAILYRYIKGNAPFCDENHLMAMRKSQLCEYEPLNSETHGKALPRELIRVVMKAMAKDPTKRYQTIAELKRALFRIIRGGSTFPMVELPAGEEVICEGDLDKTAYIVQSGKLEAFQKSGGEKISLRILEAGDVFGEMAMFASTARTASVTALTDVQLLRITEDVLRDELDSMTPWMATFLRTLAARFAERERLSPSPAADINAPPQRTQSGAAKNSDIPPWYRSP